MISPAFPDILSVRCILHLMIVSLFQLSLVNTIPTMVVSW